MASDYRGFIADALNESVDYAESFRALSGDGVVCTAVPGGIEISLVADGFKRRVPAPGDVVRYVRPQGSSAIVIDYLVLLPSVPGIAAEYNALEYVDDVNVSAELSDAYSNLGAGPLRWWRVSCDQSQGWLCVKVNTTEYTWSFSFIADNGEDADSDAALYYPLCYIPASGAPIVNHIAISESPRVPIDDTSLEMPVDEEMSVSVAGIADSSNSLVLTHDDERLKGMAVVSMYSVWNEQTWATLYYNEMRYLAAVAFLDVGDGSSLERVDTDAMPYIRVANIEDDGQGLTDKDMLIRVENKFGGYTLGYMSSADIFATRGGGSLIPMAHYSACYDEPVWMREPSDAEPMGVYEPYVAIGDDNWAPLRNYLQSGSELLGPYEAVIAKVTSRLDEQKSTYRAIISRYRSTISRAIAMLNQWLALQEQIAALDERVRGLENPNNE